MIYEHSEWRFRSTENALLFIEKFLLARNVFDYSPSKPLKRKRLQYSMTPERIYTEMPSVASMRYAVVIEQDEDGFYVGTVPGLRGCHSQGKTVDELMANMREVIQLCIEEEVEQEMKFVGVHHIDV